VGILIEHYAGAFPIWLAPVQAMIIPVSEKHREYAIQAEKALKAQSVRVEADLRNEKVGYKIRQAQLSKIPYMLIVGDREAREQNISVRNRWEGDQGVTSIPNFVEMIKKLVARKAVRP
jgi:threonyl-tRNA synthetase